MTLQVPNINDYIDRFELIFSESELIFPQSKGGDETAKDLVTQIIPHAIPIPEEPPEGPGPPHVFIKESATPFLQKKPIGKSTIDTQGPEEHLMEFYIIVVTHSTTYEDSQIQMNNITQALTTVLKNNLRLTDLDGNNPLCNLLDVIVVPYLLESDSKLVVAKNVVVRPRVFVNLR